MASNQCVIVVTPTGRRQTVKVTPNTTMLQVLEDVCKKYELDLNVWDLKHYNRIIEIGNSMRFSGLPNNATLEMVQSAKPRKESEINLGLQLESGKRLKNAFPSSETLWDIVMHWQNQGESLLLDGTGDTNPTSADYESNVQPVCIYMRHEVIGEDQLKNTTLRSLGLTHGSAIIRLIHRSENQLKNQANVSAPLSRQSTADVNVEDNKPVRRFREATLSDLEMPKKKTDTQKRSPSPVPIPTPQEHTSDEETMQVEEAINENKPKPERSQRSENVVEYETVVVAPEERKAPAGQLHLLGDHDAFIYYSGDISRVDTKITDSFFELTRADVERRLRDLQAQRRQLEEKPLQIAEVRTLEREEAERRLLKCYPVTHVRIRFPNNYVLQGTFPTSGTIGSVASFVRAYLADSKINFYLLITPPRSVLSNDVRLIDQNLIGTAVIYFGYDDQQNTSREFLKSDLYEKLSCPDAIQEYLHNKHNPTTVHEISPTNESSTVTQPTGVSRQETASSASASPTTSHAAPPPAKRYNQSSGVVPKWFKRQ